MKNEKLIPKQQIKSGRKIRMGSNFHEQKFIKYPNLGIFHCYPELLYAALLESDQQISAFTPQPFVVRVLGKRYIPDFHFVKDNQSHVIELKPNGNFNEAKKERCEELFGLHDMQFHVVSNEEVLNEKVKATNWLHIIRVLLSSNIDDITSIKREILSEVVKGSITLVGDVIDLGNRIGNKEYEIALFNLIYQGRIQIDLSKELINTGMEVSL